MRDELYITVVIYVFHSIKKGRVRMGFFFYVCVSVFRPRSGKRSISFLDRLHPL